MGNRRRLTSKVIENPSEVLQNMINDYLEGNLDDYSFLHRAVVVSVDYIGGQLENDPENPPNPPNSIKARIITDAIDQDTPEDELEVFWPMYSHDVMPLKEGEHVYVVFEDPANLDHGLWLSRIPEPLQTSNVNYAAGHKKYETEENKGTLQPSVQDYAGAKSYNPTGSFTVEKVPPFLARVGDRVVEGSNNTIIIMGRDRPDTVESGEKEEAGTIDIVAGRAVPKDLNMADDKSRIYISSKTNPDDNFSVETGEPVEARAAIVVKSDEIRVVAREGMKIVVEGGQARIAASEVVVESPKINLGGDDLTEPVILGETFLSALETMLTNMKGELGGVGGGGTFLTIPGVTHPLSATAIDAFLAFMEEYKSKVVKSK
jgi:hypothetical protein